MIKTEKQKTFLTFPNLSEDYSYVFEGFVENFKKLVAVAEEEQKHPYFHHILCLHLKKNFWQFGEFPGTLGQNVLNKLYH